LADKNPAIRFELSLSRGYDICSKLLNLL